MTEQAVSLSRYAAIFAVTQTLAILIPLSLLLVDIDLGNTNILGSMLSAFVTGYLFVRQNRREPTKSERVKLSWLSLAASVAVSLAVIAAYFAVSATPEDFYYARQVGDLVSPTAWILITIGVLGFYFAMFYVIYGWYAGVVAKALARRRSAL